MFGYYEKTASCEDSHAITSPVSTLAASGSQPSQQIRLNLQTGLAYVAAALLVSASAGFGSVYAWTTGIQHGAALACLSVAMALGLEASKPLAIAGALRAFAEWGLVRGPLLLIVGAVAVVYSLTAELSLMATTRGDVIAERAAASEDAKDISAERERLSRELGEIGNIRPSAAITAELDALLTDKRLNDCEGWVESPKLRIICGEKVAPLKAEKAKAERREKVEADLNALRSSTSDVAPVEKVADPGAHALATYLAALGIEVDTDKLSEWLVLVPVLALEAGSAFAGLLVRAFAPNTPASLRSREVLANRAEEQETQGESEGVQCVQSTRGKLTVPDCPSERLCQLLRERGGSVLAGQRTLAKALGVSTGSVNALLRELADAGRVVVEAGRSGTLVRLSA